MLQSEISIRPGPCGKIRRQHELLQSSSSIAEMNCFQNCIVFFVTKTQFIKLILIRLHFILVRTWQEFFTGRWF